MPEILSLRSGSDSADGSATESPMDILYVKGSSGDVDKSTMRQLEKALAGTRVKAFATGDAAATELASSRQHTGARALVTSPTLSNADTTQLISRVRDDGTQIAIVPVVTAADQGLRAIAAGADAVLLLVDGSLVEPQETLKRIRENARQSAASAPASSRAAAQSPAADTPAPTVSAGRRMLAELRKLQGFLDMGKRQTPDPENDEGRVQLKPRLARLPSSGPPASSQKASRRSPRRSGKASAFRGRRRPPPQSRPRPASSGRRSTRSRSSRRRQHRSLSRRPCLRPSRC
jgi:hypothetical protein